MADDSLYDDEGRTASQAQMDSQGQAQAAAAAQRTIGALQMAAQQVNAAVGEGANREEARELLGEMDAIAQGQGYEGQDVEVYDRYTRFLRSHQRGPARAAPAASSARTPAGSTPAANQATLNKRREAYHQGKTNEYPG